MKKERYTEVKNGVWYWHPTKKMKALGFHSERLGSDFSEAMARAKWLNAEWDEVRRSADEAPQYDPAKGTFRWLVDEFTRDPTFYGNKKPRTRDGIDRAFKTILSILGEDTRVRDFERRHARALYNRLTCDRTENVARDTVKWLRRLISYAMEIGVREDNPAAKLEVTEPAERQVVWLPEEIEAFVDAALLGGVAKSGNVIPPRPSLALAVQIAYEIAQQECDVLSLAIDKWRGDGFELMQIKKRGNRKIFAPVSPQTAAMIEASLQQRDVNSPYIIVDEETGTPFVDDPNSSKRSRQTTFSRLIRKFRDRAGLRPELRFADLRRTALSEFGSSGATTAQIRAISGHSYGSVKILDRYVVPDKAAAVEAAHKRWSA